MGLSNFPSAAEGVLPVLVMNLALSVALLKNMLRSVLQVMGAIGNSNLEEDPDAYPQQNARERRISTTQFKSLCDSGGWVECCVCLCRFGAEEEVSELPCKHFFHKGCLDKWFNNKNSTCPLCDPFTRYNGLQFRGIKINTLAIFSSFTPLVPFFCSSFDFEQAFREFVSLVC